MNSKVTFSLALLLLLSNPHLDAQSTSVRIIDFEGLTERPELSLSNQIEGLLFTSVVVMTPSIINTSEGVELSAATSGISTGNTVGGGKIEFSDPVIQVSCSVSPPWISVNKLRVASYLPVALTAYNSAGEIIAKSTTQVIASVAEPEQVYNYKASTISVTSSTPIHYVTLDLDEPHEPGQPTAYGRVLFDDLTLIVQEQLKLAPPVLRMERINENRVVVHWDIPSTLIQQSRDLGDLALQQSVPTDRPLAINITPTNRVMFFRGVRPTD